MLDGGNFVTKVIYLPDPRFQELAVSGVETLVSTRLEPGIDPILEADKRGTILLIVRLGAIDLEMPGGGSVLGGAASPRPAVRSVGTPPGTVVTSPVPAGDRGAAAGRPAARDEPDASARPGDGGARSAAGAAGPGPRPQPAAPVVAPQPAAPAPATPNPGPSASAGQPAEPAVASLAPAPEPPAVVAPAPEPPAEAAPPAAPKP